MADLDGPRLAPRSGTAKQLVVFLHGYGADGNDLIDIGLDRTMAALDRGLASAERWEGFIGDLCALPACILRGPRRRRRHRGEQEAEAA
jgi:hypothetical protein